MAKVRSCHCYIVKSHRYLWWTGTGKTSTVVRIVALLRQQPGGQNLRIGLAAPTGMAAARLQQSIRESKAKLPLPQEQLDAIPEEASTLHRMLGISHQGTGFRHHHDHPLLLDVLILDEASMVDVALMAKLLDALPMSARLILLGDRNQLSSVEAGSVLGDICSDCEGPDQVFAHSLSQLTGQPVDSPSMSGNGLSNSVALLRHSYRFSEESSIGRLAKSINQGMLRLRSNSFTETMLTMRQVGWRMSSRPLRWGLLILLACLINLSWAPLSIDFSIFCTHFAFSLL